MSSYTLDLSYMRNFKELVLKLFVNTSQYMGGIIAFLVLGIPVFNGSSESLSPSDLAEFISNNSYKLQNLLYLFTRLYSTLDEISVGEFTISSFLNFQFQYSLMVFM